MAGALDRLKAKLVAKSDEQLGEEIAELEAKSRRLERERRNFRERSHAAIDATFARERQLLQPSLNELAAIQASTPANPRFREVAVLFAALTNPGFAEALHEAVGRDLHDPASGEPFWSPVSLAEHEAELAGIANTIQEHRAVLEGRRLDREAKERAAETAALEERLARGLAR
jgi:hypothetical protein